MRKAIPQTRPNRQRAYDHRIMARLWPYIRPHGRPLLGALLLLPASSALMLVPPYLLKLAIDTAIVPKQPDQLLPLTIGLIVVFAAQHVALLGHMWFLQVCGQRAMHDLRVAAHRHVMSLSIRYFDRTPVGNIMTRIANDIESIAEAFAGGLVAVIADVVRLVGIVIVMLWLNAKLAALTFAVLPLLIVVVTLLQRVLRRAHRAIRKRLATINATLQEQVTGMKIVQIFNRENRSQAEFAEVNRSYRDAYKRSISADAALFAFVELVASVTVALLLWYGGLRLAAGLMSFGMLVAFIEYVQRFFEPIRDISTKYATMQQAMAASERVLELLDIDDPDAIVQRGTEQRQIAAPIEKTKQSPLVTFDAVTFGYDPAAPLFRDLSFTVPQRSQVALVGTTGAGKSTIARLLTRLYEPQRGHILLGDRDTRTLTGNELRQRVVMLNQDVFLFDGTVRDNITLGNPHIDEDAVQDAAARVGLLQIMPLTRDVRERGLNLSLGERQLVVFARALARNPELLVLDEATASIDPESERLIQEGITALLEKRTALIIAHRLSTVEHCDTLFVLHNGHIAETGTHAQLLKAGGLYSRLYELQGQATR